MYPCQPREVHSSIATSFGNDQNVVPHDVVFNMVVSHSRKFRSHVDNT